MKRLRNEYSDEEVDLQQPRKKRPRLDTAGPRPGRRRKTEQAEQEEPEELA